MPESMLKQLRQRRKLLKKKLKLLKQGAAAAYKSQPGHEGAQSVEREIADLTNLIKRLKKETKDSNRKEFNDILNREYQMRSALAGGGVNIGQWDSKDRENDRK